MSDFGLKIAQPNKNVNSNLPTDLVFSSLFPAMPISKIITLEYSIPAFSSATRRTINHGLNFVPFYLMWYKQSQDSDKWLWYPDPAPFLSTSGAAGLGLDRVDKENIIFSTISGFVTATIKIVIVVFNFPIALAL